MRYIIIGLSVVGGRVHEVGPVTHWASQPEIRRAAERRPPGSLSVADPITLTAP